MPSKFKAPDIERKWQQRWEQDRLYQMRDNDSRDKRYELTMYPYTSGDLHIGHWYAMAPSDSHARFMRMQGYNVLYPMGFDAFGLPAENAAIQRGIHPYFWTMNNIEQMRSQLKTMGAIYDWSREVNTCLPEYYRWNQWFFLQFYKAGLAYKSEAPAVWCSSCQTVLANEQVLPDGSCERCGTAITRKDLKQWFLRITRYAEELLDHSKIEWPEKIKTMQKNWIGRSEGLEVSFGLEAPGVEEREIRVFTTRPDTVYGVTFMVLAPEHPLVEKLASPDRRQEMIAYVEASRRKSEVERLFMSKEKTGLLLGAFCTNRFTGQKVPILIADYVLLRYGTGAVMGVPAHDQRDFEFAKSYQLPIKVVIAPEGWQGEEPEQAYLESGQMVNSGPCSGLPSEEGGQAICDDAERRGWGERSVTYRIRDWLISRQRYWGTPIPMINCDRCGMVPVPEEALPVLLPLDAVEFNPTGESPLIHHEGFLHANCPQCGGHAQRETDTMDTFVDSSWYHYRYCSPHYDKAPLDREMVKRWCPVDQYTGGAEHAVMHLLYARFFTKALRDLGLVDHDEPYLRLFNQGIILGEDHEKMSKSRGNVVNPDDYVATLGADCVRCFLMFIGPWEHGGNWSSEGIKGTSRWFDRVWVLATRDASALPVAGQQEAGAAKEFHRTLHQTIRRVTEDLGKFRFNTMLAALMEYTNALQKVWEEKGVDRLTWGEGIEKLLLMLAPSAPHLAEELWERTNHSYSIHNQSWPSYDETLAAEEVITLVVQVNGKVRDSLEVAASINRDEAERLALASQRVRPHIDGKQVERVIYVPGKLVNLVLR